jgi:hypothetical protein
MNDYKGYKIPGRKLAISGKNFDGGLPNFRDDVKAERLAYGMGCRDMSPSHPSHRRHKKVWKKMEQKIDGSGRFERNLISHYLCEEMKHIDDAMLRNCY